MARGKERERSPRFQRIRSVAGTAVRQRKVIATVAIATFLAVESYNFGYSGGYNNGKDSVVEPAPFLDCPGSNGDIWVYGPVAGEVKSLKQIIGVNDSLKVGEGGEVTLFLDEQKSRSVILGSEPHTVQNSLNNVTYEITSKPNGDRAIVSIVAACGKIK